MNPVKYLKQVADLKITLTFGITNEEQKWIENLSVKSLQLGVILLYLGIIQ